MRSNSGASRLPLVFALVALALVGYWYYLAKLQDATLIITPEAMTQLSAMRNEAKFADLPGSNVEAERRRNEQNLNEFLDRLLADLLQHPSKRWVIDQMTPTVDRMYLEDTEARERFIDYLERINTIVGIDGTNGAFATYLIFF